MRYLSFYIATPVPVTFRESTQLLVQSSSLIAEQQEQQK